MSASLPGKPLGELGRFVATLAAIATAIQFMGVAKQNDIHRLEKELQEVRARFDILTTVYQMREGVEIFDSWEEMEPVGPQREGSN